MRIGWNIAALRLLGAGFALILGVASLGAAAPAAPTPLKQAADLVEWGRLKEARSVLAAAVAQPENAKNAPLIAYYGHILTKFGDISGGTEQAKRAVALDDNCASCHLYLFEAMAQHTKTLGQMRALWMLPKLRKQIERADALDPHLDEVQWGWVEFNLGLPKAVGGSIADAEAHADLLGKIDPVDGHLARAAIAEDQKQPEAALAQYRAAATEHPDDPRGVYALGHALYERGEYAAASPYLARAFEMNHASALYSGYQAANLVHLKKLEAARGVLQIGQQIHPESRLGDYLVAQALKQTGQDYDWAKQLVASYLGVPPEPEQPTAAAAHSLLATLA